MTSWLNSVVQFLGISRRSSNGRRHLPPRRPSPVRRRMMIEALEDRQLLSTFSPLPGTADGAAGSLRAAVIAANGNGQDNTITLQAGLYPLTLANAGTKQENAAATGDLDVTSAGHTLTIQGVNPSATFIDASSALDRVFQVFPNATLVLRNLTVTGGFASDDGTQDALPFTTTATGGGILNHGTLTLDHVRVQNNGAFGSFLASPPVGSPGVSVEGGGVASDGTLTVADSAVANNTAFAGPGGAGAAGGLASPGDPGQSGGFADGGGVYVSGGTATITRSTISGNTAHGGTGGTGGKGGDGFINGPGQAGGNGGPGGTGAGGGLYVTLGPTVTLSASAVTGNTAQGGLGGKGGVGGVAAGAFPGGNGGAGGNGRVGAGGGIAVVNSATLTVSNSTVAANHSQGGNGGVGAAGGAGAPNGTGGDGGDGGPDKGGGLFAQGGTVNVNNSTVAFNASDDSQGGAAAAGGAAGQGTKGQGGGVRRDGGTVNAVSSIFANNTASSGEVDFSGNLGTALHNLLSDNTGSNLAAANPDANGNLVGSGAVPINAKLLALDSYGGPTQTLALRPDSPAVDAGANPDGLASDQRGFSPRAFNGTADIGAFEFGPQTPPPPTVIQVVTVDPPPVDLHRLVTRTTRVKGRTRLDVFDARTNAKKGSVFPFGRSRVKITVIQADLNGDGFADLLVLGAQGGQLRRKMYSGVDLTPLA